MTTELQQVELKTLKRGEHFKRKPDANAIYSREHYNPKDAFGPASYTCGDYYDIGRSIELKGSTLVFIGFDF